MIVLIRQCPFCKESGSLRQNFEEVLGIHIEEGCDGYYVKCATCDAQGPRDITPQLAAKKWNRAERPDGAGGFTERIK